MLSRELSAMVVLGGGVMGNGCWFSLSVSRSRS